MGFDTVGSFWALLVGFTALGGTFALWLKAAAGRTAAVATVRTDTRPFTNGPLGHPHSGDF